MITHLPIFRVERIDHTEMGVEGYLIGILPERVDCSSRNELSVLRVLHRLGSSVRVCHCRRGAFVSRIALELL